MKAVKVPVSPANPLHPKKTDYRRLALLGGAIVVVYVVLRSRSSSSGATAVVPSTDAALTQADAQGISSQISQLSSQIGLQAGGSATVGAAPPGAIPTPGPALSDFSHATLHGVGYIEAPWGKQKGPLTGAQGSFLNVNPAQADALKKQGAQLYYQNAPGVWSPIAQDNWLGLDPSGATAIYQLLPPSNSAQPPQLAGQTPAQQAAAARFVQATHA